MFTDRRHAGRVLGSVLSGRGYRDPIVLGLPRGGVVLASEVADALGAPLDIAVVRKLGAPLQPELAIGAIAEDGVQWLNEPLIRAMGVAPQDVEQVRVTEAQELARRARAYRGGREPVPVEGRTALIVDDGFATGATARAAALWLRRRRPAAVVLAAPVGAPDTVDQLEAFADEVICVEQPTTLVAIGGWYREFEQVGDDAVIDLLER